MNKKIIILTLMLVLTIALSFSVFALSHPNPGHGCIDDSGNPVLDLINYPCEGIYINAIGAGDALNVKIEGTSGNLYAGTFSCSGTGADECNGIYVGAAGTTDNWAGRFLAGNVYIMNKVGIGIGIGVVPASALDVDGTVQMTGFKMTTAPSTGYVLKTTDGDGVGTWQPVTDSMGTTDTIAKFTSDTDLRDSIMTESGTVTNIAGALTVGSSGNFKFTDASGFLNMYYNPSSGTKTLRIFGNSGSTLNVDLLDGDLKVGGGDITNTGTLKITSGWDVPLVAQEAIGLFFNSDGSTDKFIGFYTGGTGFGTGTQVGKIDSSGNLQIDGRLTVSGDAITIGAGAHVIEDLGNWVQIGNALNDPTPAMMICTQGIGVVPCVGKGDVTIRGEITTPPGQNVIIILT